MLTHKRIPWEHCRVYRDVGGTWRNLPSKKEDNQWVNASVECSSCLSELYVGSEFIKHVTSIDHEVVMHCTSCSYSVGENHLYAESKHAIFDNCACETVEYTYTYACRNNLSYIKNIPSRGTKPCVLCKSSCVLLKDCCCGVVCDECVEGWAGKCVLTGSIVIPAIGTPEYTYIYAERSVGRSTLYRVFPRVHSSYVANDTFKKRLGWSFLPSNAYIVCTKA